MSKHISISYTEHSKQVLKGGNVLQNEKENTATEQTKTITL
jgi:hypothetical protein